MKRKRYSEEQIVNILKRADAGEKPKDLCRELGIHEQTFYNWKNKYAGMDVQELRELRRLKEENTKLKRLVADQALDILMLKEVNSRKW